MCWQFRRSDYINKRRTQKKWRETKGKKKKKTAHMVKVKQSFLKNPHTGRSFPESLVLVTWKICGCVWMKGQTSQKKLEKKNQLLCKQFSWYLKDIQTMWQKKGRANDCNTTLLGSSRLLVRLCFVYLEKSARELQTGVCVALRLSSTGLSTSTVLVPCNRIPHVYPHTKMVLLQPHRVWDGHKTICPQQRSRWNKHNPYV